MGSPVASGPPDALGEGSTSLERTTHQVPEKRRSTNALVDQAGKFESEGITLRRIQHGQEILVACHDEQGGRPDLDEQGLQADLPLYVCREDHGVLRGV